MLTESLLIATIPASISVIIRQLTRDLPKLDAYIDRFPWALRKAIRCGFCLPYWLSLLLVASNNPLPMNLLFSWLIIGFTSALIRASFVLVYEGAHFLNHVTQKQHKEVPTL